MTPTEIAVLIGGALLGYWIVSSLLKAKPDNGTARQPAPEEPSGDSWYHVLGVPEYAGMDEISAAYERKMREHPLGQFADMEPEPRELAEIQVKRINAAYAAAVKLRT